MKRFNYLISLLCVVLISLSIQAEPRKQHKNMLPMDRDNNGVLSFSEFSSKSEKMFSLLDRNSDGNITRQEMDVEEQVRGEKMLSKMADRLDRNDDQRIDKNEFISASKGRSNHRQKRIKKGPPDGNPEAKKEVREAIFTALDKDKDGFLTNKELAEGRSIGPKVAKDMRFKKMDSNGNSKVSKEEFMSPIKKKFGELDKNSDELLDRRELVSFFKGEKDREAKYKNNMWKGKPPTMHQERKRR